MFTQRLWAHRMPVALTAVAATVGTVLAGGATAYAAPTPDPSGATARPQAAVKVAEAIRREAAKQSTDRAATTLSTSLAALGDIDGDGGTDLTAIDSTG
jgi:hypothetical protein